MIETKELRLGSWVEHNDEWCYRGEDVYQFQWDDSDWYALGESIMFIENINPIPLTEQWLIDFGLSPSYFESGELAFWRMEKHDILNRNMELRWFNTKIPYVHTLQNVVYDLFGEELTKK